jgi:K+-transporting ATPase ATPase A chain
VASPAAIVSIKQLGTNGGGYFGPNSAHPYENPTPLSNFVELWSIALIPMAMVWTLGYMVNRRRLAVVIFATMLAIYLPMVIVGVGMEAHGNPAISAMGVDQSTGSMEGKEVRFGAGLSALWAVTTTVTSNGSVNAMHDSLTPLGGLMPMVGMWLNNIFGGVGVGLHQHAHLRHRGRLRGRHDDRPHAGVPGQEGRGLGDEAGEPRPVVAPARDSRRHRRGFVHLGDDRRSRNRAGWLKNPGPHGFSEMLYEFTSSAANNGSGFEGLGDNTPFWNISTGL